MVITPPTMAATSCAGQQEMRAAKSNEG
jgi:hypothetical protein